MSRGQQTFRQGDVTKALKATVKAGIAVRRIEIDKDGKISVVTGTPEEADGKQPKENEWNVVLKQ
jgi:hypothetical protein